MDGFSIRPMDHGNLKDQPRDRSCVAHGRRLRERREEFDKES